MDLGDWLGDDFDDQRDDFELSICAEHRELDDDAIEFVASIVRRSKIEDTVLDALVSAAGWDLASVKLAPGIVRVRRGDFGEAIAAECLREFDSLTVPVSKLRYQIDPNQTLPGSDIVGFRWDDGTLSSLEFVEVKLRTSLDKGLAVDAHAQLRDDSATKFATTLTFLASRLFETDKETYEEFLRYLYDRGARDDTFQVCLVLDRAEWHDDVVLNLTDVTERLNPLLLRVVNLANLGRLVDESYARLGWQADHTDD